VKAPDKQATSRVTAMRYLHGPWRHIRSNVVAYLALVVAIGGSGSYALAASSSGGTVAVCVDKASGVMHLAKSQRCGRHQSRIALSSALDRPTASAWAAVEPDGVAASGAGVRIAHAGTGVYNITVTALSCRHAANNAPVVSVNDSEPPGGLGGNPGAFPVAWTEGASSFVEAFTIHTGAVVNGGFQPRDEPFNFTDSCG
jgi:hypothetical protein